MICPRCGTDTVLWRKRLTRGGMEVFLCENCSKDWSSISSFFTRYWWRTHKPKYATNAEFEDLAGLFLKRLDGRGTKEFRKQFAKIAVAIVSNRLSKKQAAILGLEETMVFNEDYAWMAGVFDAAFRGETQQIVFDASVEEKIRKLTGEPTVLTGKLVAKRIEPYLKCTRAWVQIAFDIKNDGFLKDRKRLKKEGVPACFSHPTEILDTTTTAAWMAGVFDVEGRVEKTEAESILGRDERAVDTMMPTVESSCRFRAAVFKSMLGGELEKVGELFRWTLTGRKNVVGFLKSIGIHCRRGRSDLAVAYLEATNDSDLKGRATRDVFMRSLEGRTLSNPLTTDRRHAGNGGGEDREPYGTAAETERPTPSRLNPASEFESPGRSGASGSRLKREEAKTGERAQEEKAEERGIPVPIVLTGATRKRLAPAGRKDFMAKACLVKGPARELVASDGMTVLSKVKYLKNRFKVRFRVRCPICKKKSLADEWESEELRGCPKCLAGKS